MRVIIAVLAAVAAVVTVAMLMGVEVDLRVAQFFFDPSRNRFPGDSHSVGIFREKGFVALATCGAAIIIAVVTRLLRKKEVVSMRAVLFLVSTLVLGPGLLVNGILKEHWDRPRPAQVKQFGGKLDYVNWWDPRGTCTRNCSFVSGEVSSAAWMFAPAMLAPPQWQVAAYAAASVFTVIISVARMVPGRHFLTDALFATLLTLILIWGVHWLIFKWRRPPDPS